MELTFRIFAVLQPATKLKTNFFTGISQGFRKLLMSSNFKGHLSIAAPNI